MSSIYTPQKVCCNPASTSVPKQPEVNLHIAIFFDGTCNNRINSDEREYNKASYQNVLEEYPNKKGEIPTQRNSFENDKSNIALLFENFIELGRTETDLYHKEYIEGVGTEDYMPDEQLGAALGDWGDKDLRSKVRKGCQRIANFINKIQRESKTIKSINFTAFGFSRGAAAARNFVHEVMKEAYVEYVHTGGMYSTMLAIKHHKGGVLGAILSSCAPLKNVRIKYVGLFDTVSAFGIMHSNDVKELGLDAIAKADNVFQIAAIDEYRKKFELTTIDSAGDKGKQLFLPGCHSDIGGGNMNNTVEDIKNILPSPPIILAHDYYTVKAMMELYYKECESEIKRLQNEGWVSPGSITRNSDGKYIGTRTVKNGYSAIPLFIMIKESEYIMKNFGNIKKERIPEPYNLDKATGVIERVGDKLINFYSSMVNQDLSNSQATLNTEIANDIKDLRQNHLHISHHYVTTYGIAAMAPRIVKGKLLREEYKG